jgi:signal transduction histidine kinase/CheY-like chemotaxis protein
MQKQTGVNDVFFGQKLNAVVIIIYSIVVLLMVLYAIQTQILNPRGVESPLYIDLSKQRAYGAVGFDPASITGIPDLSAPDPGEGGLVWREFPPGVPRRIINAELPGIPRRSYLSPFGEKTMEFTILLPFEMDDRALAFLRGDDSVLPGIFLGIIGDNWEIFLNGARIRSEVFLDGEGQIRSGRTWRDVFFPVDKALFLTGTNILAFRVLGDPGYDAVGLYYASPYYIEDYELILSRYFNILIIALFGIYTVMGIYHIFLFFNLKDEPYNLFYALFSLTLGVYTLARSSFIYQIIPNSNITVRIEYTSLMMLPLTTAAFVEVLQKRRLTLPTKIYGLFCLFLSLSQIFFCLQYGDEVLIIFMASAMIYVCYVFGYDLCYGFIRDCRKTLGKGPKKTGVVLRAYGRGIVETPTGNIIIGMVVLFACVIVDFADAVFFHWAINLTRYGFFIFTIGTSFILSRRFGSLYQHLNYMKDVLELSNIHLEATVRQRTEDLEEQTRLAESASRAKSEFLARMSHEIRTPMNAVIGMSHLALREELGPRAREYVSNIGHAGSNLLSVINDILDFSKIESGKLDIIKGEYQIASLINDVLSIIRIRLNEKPLLFVTRINGSLPRRLYGDGARIRQVLLNLLTNAVKYTREGHIILSIYGEALPKIEDTAGGESGDNGPRIKLCFEISDTGIGIKSEDMERLFGNFEQFDVQSNRGIEGTGLGLAISRSLCRLMGGDIGAQSVYGQGSTFSAFLPQGIIDGEPFVRVEQSKSKAVLVYENRPLYAESLIYTLENLGLPCSPVQSGAELRDLLQNGDYRFVFVSSALYPEGREILEERGSGAVPVLLAEYGKAPRLDIPVLTMPVHPVAVANILNGEAANAVYAPAQDQGTLFIAPEARVLIVDDIRTNLDVAEGLLSPYGIRTDSALSGREAVELVKENPYDLVLMDHMMPDMDGIETVAAIRAWEKSRDKKEVPVIALTANAISGMREMFLEKGFSDYLSKPIEIPKLDEIMGRWIPGHKQVKPAPLPAGGGPELPETGGEKSPHTDALVIPGVDIAKGIVMTGGTIAGYKKVLSVFRMDAQERLALLREPPDKAALPLFVIQVHALKSAAASLGAAEVSREAAALETAGKGALAGSAADMAAIAERLPQFREHLTGLIEGIRKALEEKRGTRGTSPQPLSTLQSSLSNLQSSLSNLKTALEIKNMKGIDKLLEKIEQLPLDTETWERINDVSGKVLMGEYTKALETVTALLENTKQE